MGNKTTLVFLPKDRQAELKQIFGEFRDRINKAERLKTARNEALSEAIEYLSKVQAEVNGIYGSPLDWKESWMELTDNALVIKTPTRAQAPSDPQPYLEAINRPPVFKGFREMYRHPSLSKWKVAFVTDRTQLENQLSETSQSIGFSIKVADSIKALKELLATDSSDLVMAMIHKFREVDLKETFPQLNASPHILVMTDEAPCLLFLHGNVAHGYCARDRYQGPRGERCPRCDEVLQSDRLLFPVANKDYL